MKRKWYKRNGKTDRWENLERETEKTVKAAKESFLEKTKKTVVEAKKTGSFFRAVNALKTKDAPPKWDIKSLYP